MKSNIALNAKENGQGIVLGDEETQLQFHYFWLLQKKMPLVLLIRSQIEKTDWPFGILTLYKSISERGKVKMCALQTGLLCSTYPPLPPASQTIYIS